MKKGIYKKCLECSKDFYVAQWELKSRKYCSRKCFHKVWGRKMIAYSHKRKGIYKINSGSFKKGQTSNEKNINWKGDNVGYFGLHKWIELELGKSKDKECVYCGNNKNLQWANVSWEYKRQLDDWIPLCYWCHRKYDVNNWGAATHKFNL